MPKTKAPKMETPREMVELEKTDIPLGFSSPESETISAAAYNPLQRLLEVTFKRDNLVISRPTYVYEGIPPELWLEFVDADSKGRFFGSRIRPMFQGRMKEQKK